MATKMTREEAINKVRQMNLPKETMEILEALAPELAESEDERIRRWLCDYFSSIDKAWIHKDITCIDILRWLEKQKEQKPAPKFRVGDMMRTKQEAAEGITDGMLMVVSIDEDYYICNNEKIPISSQDEYEFPPMNTEPKQEWSEEDVKDMAHIIRILDDCYVYGTHDLSKTDRENLVNKLKSLRPSWKPSEECYGPTGDPDPAGVWKPSEEQMKALLNIEGDLRAFQYNDKAKIIAELYEQLKRL